MVAQVIIRNLDDATVAAWKARAAANGNSLEQELRNLLVSGAKPTPAERYARAVQISELSPPITDVDFEELVRRDRERWHW